MQNQQKKAHLSLFMRQKIYAYLTPKELGKIIQVSKEDRKSIFESRIIDQDRNVGEITLRNLMKIKNAKYGRKISQQYLQFIVNISNKWPKELDLYDFDSLINYGNLLKKTLKSNSGHQESATRVSVIIYDHFI